MEFFKIAVTEVKFINLANVESNDEAADKINTALKENARWVLISIGDGVAIIGKPV